MTLNRRFLMGAAIATAIATPALAAAADDEGAVRKNLEAYRAALETADAKALDKLAAPQLSYSHSDGHIEDKAAFIAHANVKYVSLEFKDVTVSVVGHTAITRFHWVGHSESDGKASDTSLAVLAIWQKQGASWKLLARASCKV